MKIWYDACTGKHVRYGTVIARHFRKRGHEVIFTTREHPDTVELARKLGEKPIVVGKYSPSSLFSRLRESAKRMIKLAELFESEVPDFAIAHQSVELCRVAFGLGVPIVLTADTPHATAVNKLTVPLANTLVVSEAIPKGFYKDFGAQKIVQFRGVDEVAWIKGFKPLGGFKFERPLIVVRQMETKAAYALGKEDDTVKLAKKLRSLGNVLFLPRYDKTKIEGLTIARELADTTSIVANADLVISVGGTISREAALQGVPSIAISEISRTYVNRYLAERGFPLFLVEPSEVLECAKKYLGKRFDVKAKLADLDDPVDVIEKITVASKQS